MAPSLLINDPPEITLHSTQEFAPFETIPTLDIVKEDVYKSVYESYFRETTFDSTDLNALILAEKAIAQGHTYENITKQLARVDVLIGGDHVISPAYTRKHNAKMRMMISISFHNPEYTVNAKKLNGVINGLLSAYNPPSLPTPSINRDAIRLEITNSHMTGPLVTSRDDFEANLGDIKTLSETLTSSQVINRITKAFNDVYPAELLPNSNTLDVVVKNSLSRNLDSILNAVAVHADIENHTRILTQQFPSLAVSNDTPPEVTSPMAIQVSYWNRIPLNESYNEDGDQIYEYAYQPMVELPDGARFIYALRFTSEDEANKFVDMTNRNGSIDTKGDWAETDPAYGSERHQQIGDHHLMEPRERNR